MPEFKPLRLPSDAEFRDVLFDHASYQALAVYTRQVFTNSDDEHTVVYLEPFERHEQPE